MRVAQEAMSKLFAYAGGWWNPKRCGKRRECSAREEDEEVE